jgi:hypothetical protein
LVTYIHGNGNNHELCVEADERLVLLQTMLLKKALLDSSEEVPVKSGVNQQDEDFGDSVPVLIDTNNAATISTLTK